MSSFIHAAVGLMEFAPIIAKLISSNNETNNESVAARVVGVAEKLTGSPSVESARTVLKTSPELQLKFQQEIQQLVLQDRSNARERDMTLFSLGNRNMRADIMVLSALLGLLGCLIALTLFKLSLSGEVIGIISTIAGIFGSCLKDAYAFEFGSSRGSKEKESHLIDLLVNSLNSKRG